MQFIRETTDRITLYIKAVVITVAILIWFQGYSAIVPLVSFRTYVAGWVLLFVIASAMIKFNNIYAYFSLNYGWTVIEESFADKSAHVTSFHVQTQVGVFVAMPTVSSPPEAAPSAKLFVGNNLEGYVQQEYPAVQKPEKPKKIEKPKEITFDDWEIVSPISDADQIKDDDFEFM